MARKQKRDLRWLVNGIRGVFRAAFGVDRAGFQDVYDRMEKCLRCVERTGRLDRMPHTEGQRCRICGCVLTYKVLSKKQRCPLNKWL